MSHHRYQVFALATLEAGNTLQWLNTRLLLNPQTMHACTLEGMQPSPGFNAGRYVKERGF